MILYLHFSLFRFLFLLHFPFRFLVWRFLILQRFQFTLLIHQLLLPELLQWSQILGIWIAAGAANVQQYLFVRINLRKQSNNFLSDNAFDKWLKWNGSIEYFQEIAALKGQMTAVATFLAGSTNNFFARIDWVIVHILSFVMEFSRPPL